MDTFALILLSIVFVHGLNGDPIKTWTAGETCWPRDLLKDDIDNARVLTFGYDAKVIHFWSQPSQNRIDNHADTLLADLVSLRDRTQTVSDTECISGQSSQTRSRNGERHL